jgi:AraC-type DNA-binding domain-containing proteins
MNQNINFKKYMFNFQVNVDGSGYYQCRDTWQDLDYTPNYSKFYFICEGEGYLKIGDKEYYPKPGQLFFMPAGIKQSYSTIPNRPPFLKYWCHFTAKIGTLHLSDIIKTPVFIDVSDKSYLVDLFSQLVEYTKKDDLISALKEKSLMLEIITYFMSQKSDMDFTQNSLSVFDKTEALTQYIYNNLKGDLSIEKLANVIHFHPNYFMKFFKKHLGDSPMRYIKKIRIEKAKLLLKTTKMSIHEISDEIGFHDVYHFSKEFRNYTGFSPSNFRNI